MTLMLDTAGVDQPVVDVARLIHHLSPLLTPWGVAPLDRSVRGVVLQDPNEDIVAGEGDVLLALGVGPDDLATLARLAADAGCACVVVKLPDDLTPATDETFPLPVLRLDSGAVWLHVAELARSLVSALTPGGDSVTTGLFELADAIEALIEGPVTIEDNESRVLAFSRGQHEADEGRVATVLGRQVPQHYLDVLEELGVFRALRESDEPFFIEPVADNLLARVAVAVRAGDELLGSIWAAVRQRPDANQTRALQEAARVVALHLLRRRVASDVHRNLQADLLALLLAGGPQAPEAADRLRLTGVQLRIVACRFHQPTADAGPDQASSQDADVQAALSRLADAVAFQFGALHPNTVTGLVDGTVYTVVTQRTVHDGERIRAVAEALVQRLGERHDLVVAVGPAAAGFAELPAARAASDRVLRVLGLVRRTQGSRLAAVEDVELETLLLRLADLMQLEGGLSSAPLARLDEYDAQHGSQLVQTLTAYLGVLANVRLASSKLTVHENTLRYRLSRIRAVSGLDLEDPDTLLMTMMLLRMRSLTSFD